MLNVTAQKSPEAAKAYFAKSDYLSESQEITGNWGGKGAVLLGLFGEVDKPAFDALCDNLNPKTGKPLTALTREGRRTGYDFTWSAPKSMSVMHALTGDERIVQAFRDSINDTMSEMEAEMQTRVRKGKQQDDRITGNLIWAEFIHKTSRPVNGLPCPQLHAHCFALNATLDPVEKKFKAGQFGKIKGDSYYWQAVQQTRFANRLQWLGYSIRKTKDAFEIEGVPQSVLDKFSLRTKQIEQVAAELGITDPKAKAKLAATTREKKLNAIPYPELVERWDKQLSPDERAALLHVSDNTQPCQPSYDNLTHTRFAAEHLFERSSVIDERRLLTRALRQGIGQVTPEGVRTEAGRMRLLRREEFGKSWVTHKDVLAEERRMIGFAVKGKGSVRPLGAGKGDAVAGDSNLSAEQQSVIDHLLSSSDRVMIIRGAAGTGKTTLAREAVRRITKAATRELEQMGRHVVMVAPTTPAVDVLRNDGFDQAQTLQRLLIDPKLQESARSGVIWLDEAGLVGSKSMSGLFELADKVNARVVLMGDKRQLPSVERGAPLRVLEEIAGLNVAEIKTIRRQSGAYKDAVQLISDGKVGEGFDRLNDMGWVKLLPVWDSYKPVATAYVDYLQGAKDPKREALIVCPTHAEGGKINEQVRAELKSRGMIGEHEVTVPRLVPLQWSQAERADAGQHHGDELLQFHRNSGAYKAGQRVMAADLPEADRAAHAEHFSAYAQESVKIAPGDLIRTTAKGKTKDGKHTVGNGSVYQLRRVMRNGDMVLNNGWVLGKDFGHIAHAHVNTAYAAQGRTVKHVLLAQTKLSAPASSRQGFYVAASRGRQSLTVFTDDRQRLRQDIERSEPRTSAMELVQKARPRRWNRLHDRVARRRVAALVALKRAAQRLQLPVRQREYAHER